MKGWMKIQTAAAYADVSRETMRKWFNDGLKYAVIGSCKRTKPEWVDEFVERHKVVPKREQERRQAKEIVRKLFKTA